MLITETQIARLFLKHPSWAHRRCASGRYGETVSRGRQVLASVAAVEAAEGVEFTPAQLAAAGIHFFEQIEEAA